MKQFHNLIITLLKKGVEWEDALRAVKWREQSAVDRLTLVMEYIAGSYIHACTRLMHLYILIPYV